MRLITLLCLTSACVMCVYGFLLEQNTDTMKNNQFLSKSEFYESKTKLQDGIDQIRLEMIDLRHDMDTKLVMLTSQLRQILAENMIKNVTSVIAYLQENYSKLSANHTTLLQEFNILQTMYYKQENDLKIMRNMTTDMHNKIMNNQIKTQEHDLQIKELGHLRTVVQLQNLTEMQSKINLVDFQTHALMAKEQARNEDFLALYNLTVSTNKRISSNIEGLNMTINKTTDAFSNAIRSTENNLKSYVFGKLTTMETGLNYSLSVVKRQILDTQKRVALTACASEHDSHDKTTGDVIRFIDIRSHYGILKIAAFNNSGQFSCETEGLYLVSCWIQSYQRHSQFAIMKNNTDVAVAYITSINSPIGSQYNYYTATAVVSIELKLNEVIWIQALMPMYVGWPRRSCLTIVKIK